MPNAIEYLEERDDVVKTEYTRTVVEEGEVDVEMWHDIESLQRIAERVITGVATSQKSMKKLSEDEALAVRKTTTSFKAMYPKVLDRLKEELEKNEDYEYTRPE